MALPPLQTAELRLIDGGVPYSSQFDDIYHSTDGGLEQARQVFLAGNELPARWKPGSSFRLLETGFGLGLNFLATWQAWQTTAPPDGHLEFISIEKYPFCRQDLQQLYLQWPDLAPLASQLLAQWPEPSPGVHRLEFRDDRVTLTLLLGDAFDMLPLLAGPIDAFYLDGFAPSKNPELWSPPLFSQLARLATPGCTCATYTVAGVVRRGLQAAGFEVSKQPGFGGKRQRLCGRFTP